MAAADVAVICGGSLDGIAALISLLADKGRGKGVFGCRQEDINAEGMASRDALDLIGDPVEAATPVSGHEPVGKDAVCFPLQHPVAQQQRVTLGDTSTWVTWRPVIDVMMSATSP
jgi:hypothetical protein